MYEKLHVYEKFTQYLVNFSWYTTQQGKQYLYPFHWNNWLIDGIWILFARWNSYYDAFVKFESFLTKNRDNLAITCEHFKLKKLTIVEEEFLREY